MANKTVLVTAEAMVAVMVARLALRLLPFRWLVWSRTVSPSPSVVEQRIPVDKRAVRVGWAIDRGCRRVPGLTTCLARALAGGWMLRRRHLDSVLHLGVEMVDGQPSAHAWLEAGGGIVCGGREAMVVTPLAAFSSSVHKRAGGGDD